MMSWNCDICGKRTSINPPHEYETINGEIQSVEIKRQNVNTGKVEYVRTPKLKFLEPKAIVVKLMVGDQSIQRDVCEDCLKTDKELMGTLQKLYSILEKMDTK